MSKISRAAIWVKSFFVRAILFLIVGVCSLPSVGQAQQFGEGVNGWATVPVGSPLSATPDAACRIQFNAYKAPNNTYLGAYPSNSPRIYGCQWTTFRNGCAGGINSCSGIGPTIVTFFCKDGYQQSGTNTCAPISEVTPPQGQCPGAGNPIAIFDAAKAQGFTDYASADGKFSIGRHYRSAQSIIGVNAYVDAIRGAVGGWRFDFDPEIHLGSSDATSLTLHLPDGIAYDFTRNGNVFAPTAGSLVQSRYSVSLVGTPPASWSNLTAASTQWQVVDAQQRRTWIFKTFNDKSPGNGDYTYNIARPTSMTTAGGYQWTYAYAASGPLQSITDSYGRAFQITWNYFPYPQTDQNTGVIYNVNVPASIKQITVPGGGNLLYTYDPPLDANGNSTMVSVPRLVREEYDSSSNAVVDFATYQYENTTFPSFLTGITDARNIRFATFAYDARGRAISTQHAGGADTYSLTFNTAATNLPNELIRYVTNPLGKVTEYHFAHPSSASLSTLTSVVGQPSSNCVASAGSYTYDSNGFLASVTDEEGRVTAYVNDARGRPTSVTRGSGTAQAVTTTMTWDGTYDVATQTVEPGLTTTQTLNPATGLITQRQQTDTTTQTVPYATGGQTRTLTYGYDGTGRLTSVTGPLSGVSTSYTYDATGFLKTVTNELGQVTTVTSANAMGQPTAFTDPNGIVTALAYDGHGWLTSVSVDTAHTPATTSIAYDAVGDVTSITDPIGGQQSFVYDNARRLTSITNSAGEVVTYVRDAMGNATSVTVKNATPATTYAKTRTFDELGRLIKEVGAAPANSTYQFGYDRTDNLTSITDPRSYVFKNGFDALNRLISQTDQQNATVNLTRNGIDAITAYQDPRNLTTTYVRNGFGEIIQEASPDKGTTTYVRDARGLVTQRTDPRGIVTNFTYDNAGRLTAIAYPSTTAFSASLTWDQTGGGNYGIGRLSGISDESGVDWRVFNSKGYIQAYYRTPYPYQSPLASYYTRDAAGNVAGVNYPSGRYVGYQRDTLGRITNIVTYQTPTSPTGITIASSVTYTPYGGVRSLVQGNGLTEAFTRDTDDRITAVQVLYPNGTIYAVNLALTWMGDTLTASTDNQNGNSSQTFTYTPTGRLATAVGYYGSYAWTYDTVGNRTSEQLGSVLSTYAYPTTSNRLGSITPATGTARAFTYDLAGDIVTDTRSGALGLTYQYDVLGRLSKAFQTNAPANGGTYTYDTLGRLSARTVTKSTAPTSTTTLYVYDLDDHLIAELNASGQTLKEYIWLDDMPVAVVEGVNTASPTIYYVHVDQLKRPIRMTDNGGTWVWDVDYAPFGGTAYLYTNPEVMNARFPGQWFQLETGLHDNWHRHYDPTIGRYIQPDPMGLQALRRDGPSLYGYALQSPLVYWDPTGQGAFGGAIGGGIGGIIGGIGGAETGPGDIFVAGIGRAIGRAVGSAFEDYIVCSNFWEGLRPFRGKTKTNGAAGKDRRYYEKDRTHGDLEVYDRNGRHLGSADPDTGDITKPPVPGRTIDK